MLDSIHHKDAVAILEANLKHVVSLLTAMTPEAVRRILDRYGDDTPARLLSAMEYGFVKEILDCYTDSTPETKIGSTTLGKLRAANEARRSGKLSLRIAPAGGLPSQ